MSDEVFAEIGRTIAKELGPSMDEEVESAVEKLEDDDIIAFGLVAIRENEDGVQAGSHRAIDPERVRESDRDAEEAVDRIHDALCHIWDEEVSDR